jgi:catechol 2,3-dioxygenase-like lactoylglutathione lyase family enzyme
LTSAGADRSNFPIEEPSHGNHGVAHTFITASDFEASVAFYRQLLPFLGMTIVADTPNTFYGSADVRVRDQPALGRARRCEI